MNTNHDKLIKRISSKLIQFDRHTKMYKELLEACENENEVAKPSEIVGQVLEFWESTIDSLKDLGIDLEADES